MGSEKSSAPSEIINFPLASLCIDKPSSGYTEPTPKSKLVDVCPT
jgi:hypothetical protein